MRVSSGVWCFGLRDMPLLIRSCDNRPQFLGRIEAEFRLGPPGQRVELPVPSMSVGASGLF